MRKFGFGLFPENRLHLGILTDSSVLSMVCETHLETGIFT
jgi:hypothetical protein